MSGVVQPETPAARRLRLLDDRRALRMMGRAGVRPPAELDLPPSPIEATPRQPADVVATAPVGPPPPVERPGTLARAPEPSSLEGRLATAAGVEAGHERARGLRRLLLPVPGPGAAASEFERILGANAPGGIGEHFERIGERHGVQERLAREAHPVAGAASDVGELTLEMEALGRVPGPVGRFFDAPGLGGAGGTRGLVDEGGRIVATAERPAVGTLAGRLARATSVEGAKFGAIETGKAAAERRPADEVIARGLAGAVGGAVFGAGAQASSELLSLGVRTALRRIARGNMPGAEVPVRGRTIPTADLLRQLPPPADPAAAVGMPEHVATAGAAQRTALELTGQTPEPAPPIGTAADDPVRLAGSELAELSLKPGKTDADVARMIELQQVVRQGAPPAAEEPPAAPAAAAAPPREIPADRATLFPERREARKPREIRLPEGAPAVLGGDEVDVGKHAAKPGEEGTLPQPRNKKFAKHDDLALEARWIQINDRLEAMAQDAGEGINVWARTLPDRGTITGTTVTGKAGRAIGRIKDDKRILGELEREFHARGINPRDVMDRYIERAGQLQQSAEQTAERRALEAEAEGGGDTSFNVFEEGKPYNEAAIQDDLFGKPKLIGSLQTELLGKDAGVPTAKLKGTKLSADEIARVKREGGEPEGERPGELPGIVREPHRPYSPAEYQDGDKIVAAATLAHGRVYRGSHHGEAMDRALKNLVRRELAEPGDFSVRGEHGFIVRRANGAEQFVDRHQALDIARQSGDYEPSSDYPPSLGLATEEANQDRFTDESTRPPRVSETPAFHGSPYRFEGKFDQGKIGSGQGAASYGYGHYFAEVKDTARTYRPRQAVEVKLDGERVPSFDYGGASRKEIEAFFGRHGVAAKDEDALVDALNFVNAQGSVAAAQKEIEAHATPDTRERSQDALQALRDYGDKITADQGGAVYSVSLDVEPHEWLDWDEPLYRQPEFIQAGVRAMTQTAKPIGTWRGSDVYHALSQSLSRRVGYDVVIQGRGSPEEASRALRTFGIKGIKYLDQLSRDYGTLPKSYNYVVFDARDIGAPTRVEEKKADYFTGPKLSVLHNLSPENLVAADKLGGFPAPSLAIVPETQGVEGFGSITLIGKAELGDPTKIPVYDADAYTGRNPPPEYPKVRSKAAQRFVDALKPAAKEFDEQGLLVGEVWDELVNRKGGPRPAELERLLARSNAVRALYLREQGVPVKRKMQRVPLYHELSRSPELQAFFKMHGVNHEARPGDPWWTDYSRALDRAITAASRAGAAKYDDPATIEPLYRSSMRARFFGPPEEGNEALFGVASHLIDDQAHLQERRVDRYATEARLKKATVDEDAYKAWVQRRIAPLLGAPTVRLQGKKVPYTLENVAAATPRGRGSEGGMTFGPGAARAAATKRIPDLGWLRNAIAAPWGVRPANEVDAARKKIEKMESDWRDEIVQYYRPDDYRPGEFDQVWEGLDAVHRALGRWARPGRSRSETNLRKELAREGFRDVPAEVLEDGVAVGRAIMEVAVPYFEGKPERAVLFDEFAGAVIPDDAPAAVKEILERRGLPYKTYETYAPADDQGRGEDLRTAAVRAFRAELAQRGLNTLYERHDLAYSPWLAQRANVNEADAAFGSDEQMELAIDRAVEQLHLKPESVAEKPANPGVKAVAHYRERSKVSKQIADDLAKGQATWIGREFPNVWPEGAQPKIVRTEKGQSQYEASQHGGLMRRDERVTQITDPAATAKYRDLIDGVGAMLQTLRSPFIETLVLFATRNDQVVVSHVLTSGALSFVTTTGEQGLDLQRQFLEAAVLAGATHVHTAHNHPSGDPTPSGIGSDISMWAGLASRARKFGLTPGNNLVIDDSEYTITELRLHEDGWDVTPKFIPYHYSPKVPWFKPAEGFESKIHGPAGVAAVVHRLGKVNNGYLIHLDNSARICGLDPFTPADLEVSGGLSAIEQQVARAMERYGAARTVIGVHDRKLYDDVLHLYRGSSSLQRGVLDIVTTLPAGDGWGAASENGHVNPGTAEALEQAWVNTTVGRRVHEPGPMAMPWRGQIGYTTDPAVQGSRSYQLPAGLPADGPQAVREGLGPAYGEDGLPNTASVIAQEAIDASGKLGLASTAEGTIGKLLTAFAGTRMEQIGAPLHLVLVEYERQRAELEQLVQKDIIKESLNQSAVKFLAGLPYFNEFRAVHLVAYLRDKLPRALGQQLGVTPERQAALFDAAEAIAEFGPDGEPVFKDVRERSGELDQVGYDRLLKIYGHPAKLEAEVATLRKALDRLRGDMNRTTIALSPSAYAVERYKLGQRAKQEAKKGAAQQILSQLKTERNVVKSELAELKGSQALHAKEGILDEDAAAALPEEIARVERQLNRLRAEISRFEGVVSGKTPAGPPLEAKDLPAKLDELTAKLAKWRELRGNAKEQDEALRTRLSNLGAFRRAYQAHASGQAVGAVRITEAEARKRWAALSKSEQAVVRRFGTSAADAKAKGLEAHVNRELAKLEYEISSDIEAYVHHYGFEDEGAMTLWFGSPLRRKKLVAGARQFRGGAEGFKRNLEGARLHGGLPLSLQKLQNEFAEALERVMFTSPDPNLVRPLGVDDDVPDGYTEVLGRFGELKGQRFAVANTVYRELEFFAMKPPQAPTTDALANKVWKATANAFAKSIYYWALNQLLSIGTASRNLIGGAIQYAALVAENLAKGDLYAAQKNLLALARALAPQNVRNLPATEFGASQQTLRELDQAHGLFKAFINLSLVPFGFVENYFKRSLTLSTRELEAQRIAKEMLDAGTITKAQVRHVESELFHAPTFGMRASEELVRDAFAYNYNNIPLALRKMNKSAIGKALIPFPIYGYKFARHVGRYAGAVGRLGRMKGRAGDLQKAIAAIIIFGLPAVLTWLGDEQGKAKTVDPGEGVKYDFDRSGRVYVGMNDQGLEQWLRTNSYSFYGLGAVIGHTAHDRTLTEARNYVSEFYSVGPGFQAADYFRQVRNRYQTYRNASAIAGDFARSWIPFHRPLETLTRMVDPTRRKQETFSESMLYAVPLPEPVLNRFGLSRGEPRTAMAGAQLVPAYDPGLEFLKEFGGVNIKPIDPKQAQNEYRRAAIRAQVRARRSTAETERLRRLEERRRQREQATP